MLPKEFLERMERMLDMEYPAFFNSYEKAPCHALRVNDKKCPWLAARSGFHLTPVEWSENGYYYEEDDRPGRHPFHAAGAYYIQDASAQAVVGYLDPQPGERVLDLCAAPGGKSTQIGAAMEGEGILFCNEIHPARAKILSENVERMGITNAVVTSETPQRLLRAFPEYFHRILVDAPCSGEGMFRKNEEAAGEWSRENVMMCAKRQDEILDCAAGLLCPGGRLVYSTCTFAPLEDEGTVARFLGRHPEFSLEPVKVYPGMEPGREAWGWWELSQGEALEPGTTLEMVQGLEHTLRLWPHRIKGEGHFLAVFTKKKEPVKYREPKLQRGLRGKEYEAYRMFAAENLSKVATERMSGPGELLLFGEQLYLLPRDCPSLDQLRVLRPGLHLGTMKKNRFEPAHALALALSPEEVQRFVSFGADNKRLAGYLAGQTLDGEEVREALRMQKEDVCGEPERQKGDGTWGTLQKGWYLMGVEGMSLGWGKFDGRVMKNHYPKGLRQV